jgi:hypothetical protein
MKNLNARLFLTFIFTFLVLSVVSAQDTIGDIDPIDTSEDPLLTQERGRNLISCSAYNEITYNGYTIDEVNATNGNSSSVQSLWGTFSSVAEKAWEKKFIFDNNEVAFDTDQKRVTNIEIKDGQWPIKVLGKEIRVGHSFSELKQKFGNDLKVIHKPEINSNYVVTFNCTGNDFDGLLIDLDVETNKVEKIIYFINP